MYRSIILLLAVVFTLISIWMFRTLSLMTIFCVCVAFAMVTRYLSFDRWRAIRTSSLGPLRRLYQTISIYHFCYRLDTVVDTLPPPLDETQGNADAANLLDCILKEGPDTYQKKETNRIQVERLLGCVCRLVAATTKTKTTQQQNKDKRNNSNNNKSEPEDEINDTPFLSAVVLDIGAGKAFFTRAVYEALGRKVPCVAFDCRRPKVGDKFYDPPGTSIVMGISNETSKKNGRKMRRNKNRSSREWGGDRSREYDVVDTVGGGKTIDPSVGEAPYTRVVADVRYLSTNDVVSPIEPGNGGGAVAITKHLCGGATDGSLMALCRPPLNQYVGAACLVPCCHQKILRDHYCNIEYLQSVGFCQTHVGVRGNVQDNDFRTLIKLISVSRADSLQDFEFKKFQILTQLGFARTCELGRKARRLLEEGRMDYLRKKGFEAHLVSYCDSTVTGDNLAILAKRI